MRTHNLVALILFSAMGIATAEAADFIPPPTYYRTATVDGHRIFYREAGDPARSTIVFLHGFPSTSHEYRQLIPMLAPRYHVIAADYLGSGYSDHPDPEKEPYTFDRLADYEQRLLQTLGIKKYALYMQDFGAPVGFRLMQRDPGAVQAIIVQNANAYLDGLTPERQAFFRRAHDDKSPETIALLFARTGEGAVIGTQYLGDVPSEERELISPDSWTMDLNFLRSEKDRNIQVQLYQDYQSNIDRYPAWQDLMRERQFPTLIVWGKRDRLFIAPGAEAYLRDLPKAELHLLDAGHFAVEEKPGEIAAYILDFLQREGL